MKALKITAENAIANNPDTGLSMITTVYVLIIENNHGNDVTVHATEDSAFRTVAEYCREWWDHDHPEDPAPPIPDNDRDVVISYYSGNEHEFYSIDEQKVRS